MTGQVWRLSAGSRQNDASGPNDRARTGTISSRPLCRCLWGGSAQSLGH
jgi:hypothetical protein